LIGQKMTSRILGVLVLIVVCACASKWDEIDTEMKKAIQEKVFPGAVGVVATEHNVLYMKSFGRFKYDNVSTPMSASVVLYLLI
jgi:hypothetical protein